MFVEARPCPLDSSGRKSESQLAMRPGCATLLCSLTMASVRSSSLVRRSSFSVFSGSAGQGTQGFKQASRCSFLPQGGALWCHASRLHIRSMHATRMQVKRGSATEVTCKLPQPVWELVVRPQWRVLPLFQDV